LTECHKKITVKRLRLWCQLCTQQFQLPSHIADVGKDAIDRVVTISRL
jgi:hypothetical protein